jgi:drug/metabolite transporter (DMT)-like permease
MHKNQMSLTSWIQLCILSILWGGSFFFVKIALNDLPIFSIVFLRVFIGSLMLLLFISIKNKKLPKNRNIWFHFLVMGVLNNVIPFTMIVSAQKYIDSGFASILNATTPFFTIIIAHFFTKDEKLSFNKIIGLIIGLSGVTILIGYTSLFSGKNEFIGALMMLIATMSYAFAGVWGKRFKAFKLDPILISTGQLICSSILLLPITLLMDKPWTLSIPSSQTWFSILGIALLSTAIAYIIYFRILSTSGATNVLLVTLLIPISALLLGVVILSETFYIQYMYGIIIISIGLIIIDGRLINKIKRNKNV